MIDTSSSLNPTSTATQLRGPKKLLASIGRSLFSDRTLKLMRFDFLRIRARWATRKKRYEPPFDKLHFACGRRRVEKWVNSDLGGSDRDIDLCSGRLPWKDSVFSAMVGQHVIEHLDFWREVPPVLKELHRIAKPGGVVWLSTPDMEKVCRLYTEGLSHKLIEDRLTRWPNFTLGDGVPAQQMINEYFHQDTEHKNLFDFELLKWCLEQAGFENVTRGDEADFLAEFPAFPARGDDFHSLYVRATAKK